LVEFSLAWPPADPGVGDEFFLAIHPCLRRAGEEPAPERIAAVEVYFGKR
jgi:hypothetical protein